MRHRIPEESYRGIYHEKVQPGDLILMDESFEDPVASMDLSEGIYDSLWRLSLETGLGLTVDLRRIPLTQQEIDACDRADRDPYREPREGRLYAVRPRSEYHLSDDMHIIGYMTEETVCRIRNKDRESFLGS